MTCKGMNCGCTDGVNHSPECFAEHAAAVAGGLFTPDPTSDMGRLAKELEVAYLAMADMGAGRPFGKQLTDTIEQLADAQKEVERLTEAFRTLTTIHQDYSVKYAQLLERAEAADAELARLREAWIPVTPDTLPEMDKAVWVWSENRPLVAMRSDPENEGWCWYVAQRGWDLIEGDFEMDDIYPTAWRELPPPPEVTK